MAKKNQPELEGFERPSNPELDKKIAAYLADKQKRMDLTKREVASKLAVQQQMHKDADGLDRDDEGSLHYVYRDGDEEYVARLDVTEKVSVRRNAEDGE